MSLKNNATSNLKENKKEANVWYVLVLLPSVALCTGGGGFDVLLVISLVVFIIGLLFLILRFILSFSSIWKNGLVYGFLKDVKLNIVIIALAFSYITINITKEREENNFYYYEMQKENNISEIKKENSVGKGLKDKDKIKLVDIAYDILYSQKGNPYGVMVSYSYEIPKDKKEHYGNMPYPVIDFPGFYDHDRGYRYKILDNTIDLDTKKILHTSLDGFGTNYMMIGGNKYSFSTYIIFDAFKFDINKYIHNENYICVSKEKINHYMSNFKNENYSDLLRIKFFHPFGHVIVNLSMKESLSKKFFIEGAVKENNLCE